MIFGESTETLLADSPDSHSNELLKTFDAALQGLGKRLLLGRLRFLFFWDRSYNHLASRVHTAVDYYVDKAIDRQKKKPELAKQPSDASKRYIILDELLNTVHDRSDIRNHLLNIFLPGRDATAVGLSGVCFLLARHQHVWQKLRVEVLSIKGPLTYDVLKSLKYMRFVLNESACYCLLLSLPFRSANEKKIGFRLLMPSNSNIRLCLKDCVLPSGGGPNGKDPIFVSRGTAVNVNIGAMQRDTDIWGQDAEDFRPERWEGMKTGWHYIPFSGGPRICPGQQLTLAECAYVLARLMQRFESMENRDPEMAFIEQSRLTVESRNGVKVAFTPACTTG